MRWVLLKIGSCFCFFVSVRTRSEKGRPIQGNMRSAVYRSFVTCDDPEGVIECGTIRKSRFCPKKMEEGKAIPSGKGKKKKNQKEEDDEEDKSSRRRSSSVQLNEVAREALKLNRMADSYSNRSSFEGNSKEMAKDLLKGALDLQESLIMLGKLQESSINMAKLKKKEQNDQTLGFQKPRHSVSDDNGYSKDCFDELREAIREGLAKQNLLLKRRNPESSSSSSSSSSMIQNSKQNLIRNSTRPGNPNLIAKLMGLDHIPPRANSYKQQVKKKFEDAQPPPIVVIKPARFLNPDFDTKEMLKICELNKKQMTKAADQKPVKRLNQELGLKDRRRTRFKHQEDSLKPKASVATVPRKKKEEGIQRRRSTPPEQNPKPIAVSKSNGKTKKERIVHVPLTPPVPTISPRFQNSQHKRRQNNDKLVKAIKREEEEEDDLKLTTPKEIVPILNNADQKEDSQSEISEENKIDTKDLLLNSPIFISYAEELFNLDIDTPPNTAVVDSRSENDRRLIIDYAKEFLQERCRNRRMKESFYTHTVTLEQLAEEVCNGIGSLGWLNDRPVKEDAGLDAMIIRSWELGRREMDLIVTELEKMISRDLFDSLITDINNL